MALSNLSAHPDAVDMPPPPVRWREVRSNARDDLLARAGDSHVDLDVTAGGTFTLTSEQQWATQYIRLTGTPGAGFTIELLDGNRQFEFSNASGQTATIDTVTGATPTVALPDGGTRIIHQRGIELEPVGGVGAEAGAFLYDGSIVATGDQNWADFELKKPKFLDVAQTVVTPSSAAGVLTLDMELGNVFEVTLTEAVTTLNLNNPPATGIAGMITLIAKQDGTGGWAITWPGSVTWEQSSGLSPAQTLVKANAVDVYAFLTTDAGTAWRGFVMGLDFF